MMKILRNLMAILAIFALSACAGGQVGKVVKTAGGATAQTVASAVLDGKVQLSEVCIPGKGCSHFVTEGESVAGKVTQIAVGSVIPAAINAGAAIHVANQNRRSACTSGSCGGNTFVLEGGTAVSTSETNGAISFDSAFEAGGSCMGTACAD